ncbi:hypothetical protein H7J86_26200 [Mycobacterium hackensackense]|uniref:hypothetical protein n=1 Tax=Mycobacterium hackensackense TaxID=228909 RepID=UPI002265813B|nr:hypothetical protein [Mycobacterium hackensackense]MCV7255661.1 hypothetical protein [Mycobacterium hackensackense]
MSGDITADVLVRAWEPNLRDEGARFASTTVRRDITFQARVSGSLDAEQITMPGLVVIGQGAEPSGRNAVDVVASAIPHQIAFTILATPELIWQPLSFSRDIVGAYHFECVPYIEWKRIVLRNEPTLKGTPSGI